MVELLTHSAVIDRLGATLLHVAWQGLVLGGMLWAALAFLGPRRKRLRYLAALWTLVAMVLSPVSTWAFISTTAGGATVSAGQALEDRIGHVSAVLQREAAVVRRASGVGAERAIEHGSEPWPDLTAVVERVGKTIDKVVPWLAIAWIGGTLLLSMILALNLFALRDVRRRSEPAPPDALRAFRSLAQSFGMRGRVDVCVSESADSPCTFGLLRPVILLPMSVVTGKTAPDLTLILAHELAHVRRHDYLVSVFQAFLETFLFFHPAVWWASCVARREREHVCDDTVLTMTEASPVEYADMLVTLEEARLPMVLAASPAPLAQRVTRILGKDGNPSAGTRPSVPASHLAFFGIVLLGFTLFGLVKGGTFLERLGATESWSEAVGSVSPEQDHFIWGTLIGEVLAESGAILRMSEDSFAIFEERREAETRRVLVRPGDGAMRYAYYKDGRPTEFDESARRWLERMIRQTAFPRDERIAARTEDGAVISTLRVDSVDELRENLGFYADNLVYNAYLASFVMQARSAGIIGDRFIVDVIERALATIENRRPTLGAAAAGGGIETAVPWMLATIGAVEDVELRLSIVLRLSRFVSQTSLPDSD